MSVRLFCWLTLAPLLVLLGAAPASAHDATTTAFVEVVGATDSADVKAEVRVKYDLLMKSAWLYADAYEAKGEAEQERQLAKHHDVVSSYLIDRFQVAYGAQRCAGSASEPGQIVAHNGRAFAVLDLSYACSSTEPDDEVASGSDASTQPKHEIFSALFPTEENFVHDTVTMVDYDLDGVRGSARLTPAAPQEVLDGATSRAGARQEAPGGAGVEAPGASVTPRDTTLVSRLGAFVLSGAEHLWFGFDHLLFLVALMLGARGWRDVVLSVTMFTLAHSVTFALGSLGVVEIPAAVIEPVIALSIIVVALLGLRDRQRDSTSRWRLPVVFCFGLLHGLGFASALGIDEPGSWTLLSSLLAFNVGIELAQLAVVVLVFPVVLALRTWSVGPRLLSAAAVAVAVMGGVWLMQRLPSSVELGALLVGG